MPPVGCRTQALSCRTCVERFTKIGRGLYQNTRRVILTACFHTRPFITSADALPRYPSKFQYIKDLLAPHGAGRGLAYALLNEEAVGFKRTVMVKLLMLEKEMAICCGQFWWCS